MTWEQLHPAINAALNLTCFVFLVLGRVAIARDDVALHRRRMLGAVTASSVFLVSYLIRFATTVDPYEDKLLDCSSEQINMPSSGSMTSTPPAAPPSSPRWRRP